MTDFAQKTERLKALNRSLIAEKEDEVKRLRSKAECQTINYEKTGASGINADNGQELRNTAYIKAKSEYDLLIEEQAQLAEEITDVINKKISGDAQSPKRRIAKLHFVESKRIKEIAEITSYSEGTVKNYLSKIKSCDLK